MPQALYRHSSKLCLRPFVGSFRCKYPGLSDIAIAFDYDEWGTIRFYGCTSFCTGLIQTAVAMAHLKGKVAAAITRGADLPGHFWRRDPCQVVGEREPFGELFVIIEIGRKKARISDPLLDLSGCPVAYNFVSSGYSHNDMYFAVPSQESPAVEAGMPDPSRTSLSL